MNIAANDSSISYIGRWADLTISSAPAKLAISGGTRLRFRFTGTSLTARFDLTPTYTYPPEVEFSVDGGAWSRKVVNATSIVVATGLADTNHTVEMWVAGVYFDNKWNTYAGVRATGFIVDDGRAVSPWPTGAAGRMLTVGDSIAEGMLALGSSPNAPVNWSGRLSMSSQVAAQLNLENWNVTFGGSGFYGTHTLSGVPATHLNYPYKANGLAKSDPPFDIILVESVNNDGAANVQTAYENLLDQLKADHPNAKIFCLGLLYPNPANQSYVQAAAENKGATYISPSGWSYSRPNLSHPDVAGHTALANYLVPILQPYVPAVNQPASFTTAPFIQSLTVDGAVIAYGTADPEANHYRLDRSLDDGSTWAQAIAEEIPGDGKNLTLFGLLAGIYQVRLRIVPLTGDTTPIVSESVQLVVAQSPALATPSIVDDDDTLVVSCDIQHLLQGESPVVQYNLGGQSWVTLPDLVVLISGTSDSGSWQAVVTKGGLPQNVLQIRLSVTRYGTIYLSGAATVDLSTPVTYTGLGKLLVGTDWAGYSVYVRIPTGWAQVKTIKYKDDNGVWRIT